MPTDAELLNLALGDESRWDELHELCLDRRVAEQLARALERTATLSVYHAAIWAGVLAEIHSDVIMHFPTV